MTYMGLSTDKGLVMKKFLRLLAVLLGASLLAACVTPGRVSNTQDSELRARFGAGGAILECGSACTPLFSANQQRIQQLLRERDWDGLALAVMRIDWRQDISYFLLGTAAEGKKQYAAADRYYRMAGALANGRNKGDQCATSRHLCLGFNLPADVAPRLNALAQQVQSPVVVQATPPIEWIPDAPQALLGQYALKRLMSAGSETSSRDVQFREDLLRVFEPVLAEQTRGNEIARPRAIAALVDRLGNQVTETRLTLGMFVQLKNYDLRKQSFEIHYPLHTRQNRQGYQHLGWSIYSGRSQQSAPWVGYSSSGTTCVFEQDQIYVPASRADAYFAMLTMCHPHPSIRREQGVLDTLRAELPPVFNLNLPGNSLWQRVAMANDDAEALIRRLSPSRQVWAELVFDVRAITQTYSGPFAARQVIEQKAPPALTIDIQPRALVMWEPGAYNSGGPGRFIGALGDVQEAVVASSGRLPTTLVADREYLPSAAVEQPAASAPATVSAPTTTTPARSRTTTPASRPASSSKVNPQPVDEDRWVEPPAAKR